MFMLAQIVCRLVLCLALLTAAGSVALALDDTAIKRRALVREVQRDVLRTSEYLGKEALDERVIEVLGRVPRHEFVPESMRPLAYENRPLPIGNQQTISQPYVVAVMTDLLQLPKDCRVLEVGTGSGYQAAILAELCAEVYTIEIVAPLGQQAAATLERLGYDNVQVRIGDGYAGWTEHAPFDGIMVTAGASHVPPALVAQLSNGGRLVAPIGDPHGAQMLVVVTKLGDGSTKTDEILPVIFVPLTGGHD
jgi:protein-L-isoaspartate(D-aspartate) O-methyltransferase